MRWITIAALSLVAAACSASKPTVPASAVQVQRTEVRGSGEATPPGPTVVRQSRGAVLARLQFRDHVLVIRAGSGERRYDVHTRGGALLASSLTREELDLRFPAIAEHFRESTAIQLDATLERSSDRRAPFEP